MENRRAEIFDSPGCSFHLERYVQEFESDVDFDRSTLQGVFRFMSGFCIPLSVDLSTLYWMNEFDIPIDETFPTSSQRTIRAASPPEGMRTDFVSAGNVLEQVDELSYDSVHEWFVRSLDEDRAENPLLRPGWDEIWIRYSMARTPEGYFPSDIRTMPVHYRSSTAEHPVIHMDESIWIAGPMANTLNAPIEIQLIRTPGRVTVGVYICWNIWMPDGAGYGFVESGVSELLAAGWAFR